MDRYNAPSDLMSMVNFKKRRLAGVGSPEHSANDTPQCNNTQSSSTSSTHTQPSAADRLAQMHQEVLSLRSALSTSEARAQQATRTLHREKERYTEETNTLQRLIEEKSAKAQEATSAADNMRVQHDLAVQRYNNIREQCAAVEEQLRQVSQRAEQEQRELESKTAAVKQEMKELESRHSRNVSVLSQSLSINTQKSRLAEQGVHGLAEELSAYLTKTKHDVHLANENADLRREIARLKGDGGEKGKGIGSATLENTSTSTPSTGNSSEADREMITMLQREVKDYRLLEVQFKRLKKENEALKAKSDSDVILNTKIRDLESAVQRSREREERMIADQVRYKGLIADSQEGGYLETAINSILQSTAQLRAEKEGQDETLDRLTSRLDGLQQLITAQRAQLSEASDKHQNVGKELKDLKTKFGTLQRRSDFYKLEIRGLQDIIKSFYAQDKVFGHNNETYELHANKLQETIDGLNKALDEQRDNVVSITSERDDAKRENTQLSEELRREKDKTVLEAQTLQLTASTASASMRTKEADVDVAALRMKLNQATVQLANAKAVLQLRQSHNPATSSGTPATDYDPRTTKVIHLRHNPVSDSLARCQEELQHEVVRLTQELTRVEQSVGSSTHTAAATAVQILDENKALREQLKTANNRNNVIKEMFAKKFSHFREVVYTLFGFKIDMDELRQYKLLSIYAESKRDYLLFKGSEENGRVDLLESEYSKHLSHNIAAYLGQCRSYPAFLSTITLELFNNQTFRS
ncbi:hypothetical protein SARC_00507 [Sphaeroforma arctica JP610]|uniref:Spindle assembly checkpoint component MAD1 n=1 Tax=Sphaeroforma arctica JP610 TaxID=667725 RepID=A0A0L0GER1_9EUKA|nr:hypothetical protein SARC_00507 [Sphaeroforma arctica JP610]KNC87366.1 hypothetical protein SARC_00507 [Sphaeroforma arctica JP610]|eukprot:XP_014161268.1 hypothetical protein SARC_00507 [Sphaeroforma arctica JP610]